MNVKTEKSQTTVSFDNLREKNDVSFDLQVVNDVNTTFFEFFPMKTPEHTTTKSYFKKNTLSVPVRLLPAPQFPSTILTLQHPSL